MKLWGDSMEVNGKVPSKQVLRGKVTAGKATDAYTLAVANGFEGTIDDWFESLKGEKGDPGYTPVKGLDYYTETEKTNLIDEVLERVADGILDVKMGGVQGYTFGTIASTATAYSASYTYAEKIEVENNEIFLVDPITETFTSRSTFNSLIGMYFQEAGVTYYVPENVTMSENTNYNASNIAIGKKIVGQVQIVTPEDRNGKDGVSATHEWNGTVLTITSASGTSSADLKGEKGDTGEKGEKGDVGEPGRTPVKGTDYWTEEDKNEIKSYIDESLGVIENGSY